MAAISLPITRNYSIRPCFAFMEQTWPSAKGVAGLDPWFTPATYFVAAGHYRDGSAFSFGFYDEDGGAGAGSHFSDNIHLVAAVPEPGAFVTTLIFASSLGLVLLRSRRS